MSDERATEQLLTRWATWMRGQSWSEDSTVKNRLILVRQIAGGLGMPPEHLDSEDVLRFLSSSAFGSATRQTYHAWLGTWFRWLVEAGVREENPLDGVPRPKAGKRRPRYISTSHVQHLLGTPLRRRTRAMCLLMGYQGLRAFEVAKFRGTDIDLRSRELRVIGKGDVEAVLPLHPVIEALAGDMPRGWWFPQYGPNRGGSRGGHILGATVGRTVGDAMRRADVPGTGHSLRHWFGTELLRAGVDTRITQELMRHATIATTERYLHVDDTQRREGLMLLPLLDGVAAAPIPTLVPTRHQHRCSCGATWCDDPRAAAA